MALNQDLARPGPTEPVQAAATQIGIDWLSRRCGGAEPHRLLSDIEETLTDALLKGELSRDAAATIGSKISQLDDALDVCGCDQLNAYAIQVLRTTAFVKRGEQDWCVWRCFALINTIWQRHHPIDVRRRKEERRRRRRFDPVFDEERLLDGWLDGLGRVQPEALHSYVQVLRCEGLLECPRFANEAVPELKRRVVEAAKNGEVECASKATDAFIRRVLETLVDRKPELVADHLGTAAEMLSGIGSASPGTGTYVDAPLRQLAALVNHLGMRSPASGSRAKRIREGCHEVYHAVSGLHEGASRQVRRELGSVIESFLPAVGGWPSRPRRRRAPEGATAELSLMSDGCDEVCRVNAQILDVSEVGRGLHIALDPHLVKECCQLAGSEEDIPGEKATSARLCVTGTDGQRRVFRQAVVQVHLPPLGRNESPLRMSSEAWLLRGWNYAGEEAKGSGCVLLLKEATPELLRHVGRLSEVLPGESRAQRADTRALPDLVAAREKAYPPFKRGGGGGILDGLREWFEQLSDEMRRGSWRSFWGRPSCPVDEAAIQAHMKEPLDKYVTSRGGRLSREENRGVGQCDFVVSYDSAAVGIEVKHDRGDWRQGIEAELPTNMGAMPYGLFVMFAFQGTFGRGAGDLSELLQLRDRVCAQRHIRIDVAVVSCDKPVAASKRKRPSTSGEGFQYYEGPEPREPGAGKGTSAARPVAKPRASRPLETDFPSARVAETRRKDQP